MLFPKAYCLPLTISCLMVAGLSGCAQADDAPGPSPTSPSSSTVTYSPKPTQPFDAKALPISTVSLPPFPYVPTSPPADVSYLGAETLTDTQAPIWTGAELKIVRGTIYQRTVKTGDGNGQSRDAALRDIENLADQLGAVKITHSDLSDSARKGVEDLKGSDKLVAGLGDLYNQPVATYVAKRQDKTIWLQTCQNSVETALLVVEGPPL